MLIRVLKKIFFYFYMYKIDLIWAERYKTAEIDFLKIKTFDEIWASMKRVHDGLGVNSMSDLVFKEKRCMKYERSMKEKILQIMKFKNIKWL